MTDAPLPIGPDRDAMITLIRETWPDAVVATIESAAFFSLDEKHWPNFATVVWTDEHDEGAPSRLSRPGVYRLNIGIGKETFQRLVGAADEPEYTAFDRILPHPVYARQRWISILNPSDATLRGIVMPLLTEAHDRLVAQRERQGPRDMTDRRKRVVASGYDRLAERYLKWGAAIESDPRHRMLAEFSHQLPAEARILDLGCGAGIPSTQQLAQRFDVIGVDISRSQLELARRNVPRADFILGDFSELQFPQGAFQGVVALYAVSHLPREEHGELFVDVFRWLAPGGLFLATLGATDSPDWTGEWLGEEMFFSSYDADANRRLMRAAGFELLVDEVAVTHEPEGDVSFLWVIGQKPGSVAEDC